MNKIINDYGEHVVSVGADFSDARAFVMFPKLIRRVDGLFYISANDAYLEALELVKREQPDWVTQIMRCSMFNPNNKNYTVIKRTTP